MVILQQLSYKHPDQTVLFDGIHLTVNKHQKIALIGNNGSGKSTLLRLIAKELQPSAGVVSVDTEPYYVPQIFGQYNHLTVAQALKVDQPLQALTAILNGAVTEEYLNLLNDDWTIEERCYEALHQWQLPEVQLTQQMGNLSGGQKTKVFLAGISIHRPKLVLLDEPSNHLDLSGRQLLYESIASATHELIVVSHDRKLLNLLDTVCELSTHGIAVYGGNYDFYAQQKEMERNALYQHIHSKERQLKKAKEKERETIERKEKQDARGRKKHEKEGVPRIVMNTLKNNAEQSTAKIKGIHGEKMEGVTRELKELRSSLPDIDKMRFGFEDSGLHKGKLLFKATQINYAFHNKPLWREPLSFDITSGERIALHGLNGSGKTTLIHLIRGTLEPHTGSVVRAHSRSLYIDQDYSLIDNSLTVSEQAARFNTHALQEHEINIRLNRFLFTKETWNKPCIALSGGEKMRLLLCCLTLGKEPPDMILLDEPTNNLDLQNIDMLVAAIHAYEGTLIVVSHDVTFLEQIKPERTMRLS